MVWATLCVPRERATKLVDEELQPMSVSITVHPTLWCEGRRLGRSVNVVATFSNIDHSFPTPPADWREDRLARLMATADDINSPRTTPRREQGSWFALELVPLDGQSAPPFRRCVSPPWEEVMALHDHPSVIGIDATMQIALRSRNDSLEPGNYGVRLRYRNTISDTVAVTIPERPDRPERIALTLAEDNSTPGDLIASITNTGNGSAIILDQLCWYCTRFQVQAVTLRGKRAEDLYVSCGTYTPSCNHDNAVLIPSGHSHHMRIPWPFVRSDGSRYRVRMVYSNQTPVLPGVFIGRAVSNEITISL